MELRQLRHFLEVIRRASFGEAAEAVNLSQPAISKSIKKLEDSLKIALFERTPSGVFPTVYGKVLVDYAELIENQVNRAIDELEALRGSRRGLVRIGAGPSISRNLLPDVILRFGRRLPDVDVALIEASKEELFLKLSRGEIDLIVSSITEADRKPDFQHRLILRDNMDIVAAIDHPLAQSKKVELSQLSHYRWVIPAIDEPERNYIQRFFADAGLPVPKAAVQTLSLGFLVEFLPGTDHLSYVSRRLSGLDKQPQITALPVDLGNWVREVGVTTRREGVVLPAVRVMLEELDKAGRRWAT